MGLNPSGQSAGSLGHVEGPVCDVIGQPGVAGETGGQEGVVAAVGGAVLHDPGEQQTTCICEGWNGTFI